MAKRRCQMCGLDVRAEEVRTDTAKVWVIMCPRDDTRKCQHCGGRVSDRRAEKCPKCKRDLRLSV